MDINVSAGTTIWVSASVPATTYTQIRGVRSVSDLGVVTETVISRPVYGKPKLVSVGKQAQTVLLELYRMTDDGQTMLKSLVNSRFEYSFKVMQSNGETNYFTATASQHLNGVGTGSTIFDARINLELTSDITTE